VGEKVMTFTNSLKELKGLRFQNNGTIINEPLQEPWLSGAELARSAMTLRVK
jgi:hypothetical protein